MDLLALVLIGLAMGLVFGTALEKSRVFEPGMIVGQMQLRSFIMLKVFLAATATGLVVLAALNGFGLAALHPKALVVGNTLIGGLILGAGITLAGACPGTVLAQIGAGYRDAWATLIGGILGAMAYGYFRAPIDSALAIGDYGKLTLADVTGLPFWLLALGGAALLIAAMAALERWRPWRRELGDDYDGVPSKAPTARPQAVPTAHGRPRTT